MLRSGRRRGVRERLRSHLRATHASDVDAVLAKIPEARLPEVVLLQGGLLRLRGWRGEASPPRRSAARTSAPPPTARWSPRRTCRPSCPTAPARRTPRTSPRRRERRDGSLRRPGRRTRLERRVARVRRVGPGDEHLLWMAGAAGRGRASPPSTSQAVRLFGARPSPLARSATDVIATAAPTHGPCSSAGVLRLAPRCLPLPRLLDQAEGVHRHPPPRSSALGRRRAPRKAFAPSEGEASPVARSGREDSKLISVDAEMGEVPPERVEAPAPSSRSSRACQARRSGQGRRFQKRALHLNRRRGS